MSRIRNLALAAFAAALTIFVVTGCNRGPKEQGVDGLASLVPSGALAFVATDLRQSEDWEKFLKGYDLRDDHPKLQNQLKNLDQQLGMKVDDLINGVEPAGCAVVVDTKGEGASKDLALVALCIVRNQKRVEACISELTGNQDPTLDKLGESTVKSYPIGLSTCFKGGFLYLSTSVDGLKAVIEHQGEKLDQRVDFKQARQQIDGGASDVFAFMPLGDVLGFVSEENSAVAPLGFLATGLQTNGGSLPVAYLKVEDADSPVGKALLASPESSAAFSQSVPKNWGLYFMSHLGYQLRATSQILSTTPAGQGFLKEISDDLKAEGTSVEEIGNALTGEVAVAIDFQDYFKSIPQQVPDGMIMVGIKDPRLFTEGWTRFCAANGLVIKSEKLNGLRVDKFDGYPEVALAHRDTPYPMAMLAFGSEPISVLETATSVAKGESLGDIPALKSEIRPTNIFTLRYDLGKALKQLAATGLLALNSETAAIQTSIESNSEEMWAGQMTIRVEQDGIKVSGTRVTMLAGALMTASVGYAFYEESR